MNHIYIIIASIIFLLSCEKTSNNTKLSSTKTSESNTTEQSISEEEDNLNKIQTVGLPVRFVNSEYLIFPVGTIEKVPYSNKTFGSKNKNYRIEENFANATNTKISGNMTNLYFQKIGTSEFIPLTNKPVVINSIDKPYIDSSEGQEVLLYHLSEIEVKPDDLEEQYFFDELWISNLDGSDFKQLSKENETLLEWKLITSINRLYYTTVERTYTEDTLLNRNNYFINTDNFKVTPVQYDPMNIK